MWGPEVFEVVHLGHDLWESWQIGSKRKTPWLTQHSSHYIETSDTQFRRAEKAIKVQQKQAVTIKKYRVWCRWNFIWLLSKSRKQNPAPELPIQKNIMCHLLIFYPRWCDHAQCKWVLGQTLSSAHWNILLTAGHRVVFWTHMGSRFGPEMGRKAVFVVEMCQTGSEGSDWDDSVGVRG